MELATFVDMSTKEKRKSYDSLHVRIPRSLKARLRKRSALIDRSMTDIVLDLLSEDLRMDDNDLRVGPGLGDAWLERNTGVLDGKITDEDFKEQSMVGDFLRNYEKP